MVAHSNILQIMRMLSSTFIVIMYCWFELTVKTLDHNISWRMVPCRSFMGYLGQIAKSGDLYVEECFGQAVVLPLTDLRKGLSWSGSSVA